ncbi:MAG: hypothetical protein IT453_21025, partial [Planctomycetes bacterium]|nr:hypothetical protein [Planctomycetota bacterium]
GAVVGAFGAQGERVRYSFDARAGETCSLDLACYGNARGWRSTARVRVLGPDGRELAALVREGPTLHHVIVNFVAERTGPHVYELGAERHFFRFRLALRVGAFAQPLGSIVDLGERAREVGCLLHDGSRARYRVPVAAGEELAIALTHFEAEARVERRTPNPRRPMDGTYGSAVYPGFALEVLSGATVVAAGARFARVRAERAGSLELEVRAAERGDGGLYVLELAREPRTAAVGGLVLDEADRGLGGVALEFLRLPDREPWAHASTDAAGAYRVDVAPGEYEVRLALGTRSSLAATHVGGERELNLIFAPR